MKPALAGREDHPATGDGQHTHPARRALAALSLSMLLSSLGTSIANVALPSLAKAFNASFQDVQWVVLAYLLAVTTLIVSAGRLGDLLGRRRLLLAGIGAFTAASALCGLAPTLPLLIAARTAQGLAAAVMMALTTASVGPAVAKDRTGSAMGLLGTMSAVGTGLGPSLGGLLISASTWRAVFLACVPLGALALVLARRHLPADRPDRRDRRATAARPRFDPAGTALLALTLAAYALAMTLGRGRFGPLNLALLGAAAAGAGLFLLTETRVGSPLLRPAMLRTPGLGAGLAMSGLVSTVMMATLVVGPFHLAGALGLPAALVGLAMSAGPLVTAFTAVPAGRLVDRLGARRVTFAGLVAMAAAATVLAAVPAALGVAGYLVPLVVLTIGYALFQTANNTAVMADVDPGRRGVVSGLLNLSRNLGLVTGASVMGAVFALGAATADVTAAPPAAVASGTRTTFAVAAVLIGGALALGSGTRTPSRRRFREPRGAGFPLGG
ncbi:MFS transporter [Streptomyces sp. NPDC046876]|uniref:MFS transporter n=1 Tax=Streptomyces sp. NPDC046876 TaxID=3155616 RepID=UPI00340C85D3